MRTSRQAALHFLEENAGPYIIRRVAQSVLPGDPQVWHVTHPLEVDDAFVYRYTTGRWRCSEHTGEWACTHIKAVKHKETRP